MRATSASDGWQFVDASRPKRHGRDWPEWPGQRTSFLDVVEAGKNVAQYNGDVQEGRGDLVSRRAGIQAVEGVPVERQEIDRAAGRIDDPIFAHASPGIEGPLGQQVVDPV